ncbi:MBL fold metallo-hydrolase [Candidatus Woesearchaeota archaeon]|nr:MBL fold metallo-hydrolase [Candidatus Woesearchaeota archaeon]
MPIEVCCIGGFSKTEGNSVAIKIDEEVVILDMGLSMEDYIKYTEDREDISARSYTQLLKVKAVPNYTFIEEWKEKIKAIIPSHGHLDHVGAIPFAAKLFPTVPVISTPYTIEVLKTILVDEQMNIPNQFIAQKLNSSYKLSEKITVEFINVTHSIPHTAIVVLHTPYGKIMYANDFKLDDTPTLGKKPNYQRIKKVGKEGVLLLIMNCLYAHEPRKCPSEAVARQMLKEVMLGIDSKGKAMIVTTFSSHIARLKSIIEMGKKLKRKIVFLGRSLDKYVRAAERLKLVQFTKDVELVRHWDKVERIFKKIQREGKDKYLIVCTGHQGEPRSILTQMAAGGFDFHFTPGDLVIFSCQVIPVEVNKKNREILETSLRGNNVRIFRDVHVSGHGAREDERDLIEMVRPKHIIPIHAENEKARIVQEMATQLGFKNTHVMLDGQRITLE